LEEKIHHNNGHAGDEFRNSWPRNPVKKWTIHLIPLTQALAILALSKIRKIPFPDTQRN
jgi:hypothetical protein